MSDARPKVLRAWAITAFLIGGALLMLAPVVIAQSCDPTFCGLRWRMIGPFRAGRVNAVSGVMGQPETCYVGSVGGGVWKTNNAGRTWKPVFDSQSAASIGAIGVAPSDPNVVYVGTGEADMRDSIQFGDGMYKSSDGGKTWRHIGLENTRQIGRVIVDPKNPNIVFVAALGHAYGPSPDRGVYRSRDGGATWQKVLFKNEDVGAIDLTFDPTNSQIVYATTWNVRRPPWFIYAPANGPGGGIFKSTDGGTTWKEISTGIPLDNRGRIGIAVAPTNRNRVYAMVDAKEGGLFVSNDAGTTWTKASKDERVWGRGWYFSKVAADPKNADIVYASNTSVYRSTDAGKTWTAIKGAPGGDDYHQLWIYPDDPKRMVLGSDQGAIVTVDGAETWSSWYNQSTAQIYHVVPDRRIPYRVTGAQQDSGAVGSPSRSRHSEISNRDWEGLCSGGESGYTAPDPLHPEILYGGTVSRCNVITGETKNVSPERGGGQTVYRHDWTQPLVFSPADPHALYYGNQFLYKTTNGGESWTQISQDMTREDPGVPSNLNEAAAADAPKEKRRGVIYTIAPSPLRAPMIWIGTDDGLIQGTNDDGKTWKNVTPPALTSWSKVVMIEASHFDVDEAYAAVERHQLEDYEPHIYRTRDAGRTWTEITSGLPGGVYVQTVKEDPQRRGLLFAGTERAVYVSFDDGDHWKSLQLNLPPASMRDLAIHDDDLIVATHGRGFWVLDDITALRQINDDVVKADAFLFRPADAVNITPGSDNGTPMPRDEPLAENPPTGALIDYYLKSNADGPVTLEILDPSGEVIRRYSSEDKAPPVDPDKLNIPAFWVRTPEPLSTAVGMHRWIWDLRPTPPARPAGGGGGGGGGGGFGGRGVSTVLPGTYTVKLTAGGKSYTQPLVVKMDPRAK
ncbi:MAG TPA: YCF48-related protein [Pyrinomonadaceae bacterium]|nr:YCF48-related protein [Pyrinomonadaceae bacterium]